MFADLCRAVERYGAFGVPTIVFTDEDGAGFGPVVAPAAVGDAADRRWEPTVAHASFEGTYEMKAPKTASDRVAVAAPFAPYLAARPWPTIERPAP